MNTLEEHFEKLVETHTLEEILERFDIDAIELLLFLFREGWIDDDDLF